MLSKEKIKEYAKLALEVGANLQKGQKVVLRADVQSADFVHVLAQTAYELGSDKVYTVWSDEHLARLSVDHASEESLSATPAYDTAMWQSYIDEGCVFVSVISANPNNYAGCDSERLTRSMRAARNTRKNLSQATMSNKSRWTLVAIPSVEWAKIVFPNCSETEAVDKLWDAIAHTVRLDTENPVQSWRTHISNLTKHARWLNEKNFEYIHFSSKNGTDLKVGLAFGHEWTAADEKAQDGFNFVANLPTEEVFTAPHSHKVDGIVYSALPLVDNGTVIDNFSLTFKDGKVVDFTAEKGYDGLKAILTCDEGSARIGEIALIGKNSPIAQSGLLYYNTLFDENASCHLALGQAYPTTVKNGNSLSEEQKAEVGLNKSLLHVDFMIGTKDLKVTGIAFDGTETPIFEDGEWIV